MLMMMFTMQRWPRCTTALLVVVALVLGLGATATSAAAQPVLPPIAPPRPAAPRNPNALVISNGDLNEAVNWARQGNLDEATTSFNLFKDDWDVIDDDVRAQSDDIASQVQAAIDQLDAALAADPPPDQSTYYPMFQNLGQVVEDANTQLGSMATSTALRINPTNLSQSVNWASQGNLARAHDEFNQFQDDWSLVKDAVRQQMPLLADGIDAGIAGVLAIIANPADANPPQAAYYPALQGLLLAVNQGNAQLATLPPPAAGAAPTPTRSGPIQIRAGNLGESVDWATQGNLASARSEFGEFQDDWAAVQAAVRSQRPDVADQIDAAIASVKAMLASPTPDQSQYLPAIQAVQTLVADANKQLGN